MIRPFFKENNLIWSVLVALFLVFPFTSHALESRKVSLRIIVVKSPSEAKDILSKLRKGVPFTKLASERSRDKSRARSGDLGTVDISRLEPPLRKAVAKMKEGDISGAIRLRKNKYAIVQVLDFSHYRKGAVAFREGEFGTAKEELLEHLKENPDAAKARIMLGEIYERDKDPQSAEKIYKEVLSYDRKSWIAYVRLGKLYMDNGEYKKARDIYETGLRYIPKAEGFRTGMKEAAARLSSGAAPEKAKATPPPAAAVAAAPERTQANVSSGERTMNLRMIVVESDADAEGLLRELKGGKSFALLARDRSIDEGSRAEFGYLGEVNIGSLASPLREAVRTLKPGQISRIIKLDEGHYAIMLAADFHYFKEGENAFIREDFKTAEKKLLKHLELNEDDAGAHLMLGAIYEEKKEYRKAEEIFRRGVSYHPKVVLFYLRLGKLYQAQRQFQKSKDVYTEGFRNVPTSEQLAKAIEMVDILLYNENKKNH